MPIVVSKRVAIVAAVSLSAAAAIGVGVISWHRRRERARSSSEAMGRTECRKKQIKSSPPPKNSTPKKDGLAFSSEESGISASTPKRSVGEESTPKRNVSGEDSGFVQAEEERKNVEAEDVGSEALETPSTVMEGNENDAELIPRNKEETVQRVLFTHVPQHVSLVMERSQSDRKRRRWNSKGQSSDTESVSQSHQEDHVMFENNNNVLQPHPQEPCMFYVFDTPIVPEPIQTYEFEVPQSVVGVIIGKKGAVIQDLIDRSGTQIEIREHHLHPEYKICRVKGSRSLINRCMNNIRRRFPPCKYPELTLWPLPPRITARLSCVVNAGHVFLQVLSNHDQYKDLSWIDSSMQGIYDEVQGIPELPKPIEIGVLCAALSEEGSWLRAVTCVCDEESDMVLVRFVDHGGYSWILTTNLRQIRWRILSHNPDYNEFFSTIIMDLPFQATECYLNAVGEVVAGSEAAFRIRDVCTGKVLDVVEIGFASDGIPVVNLFVPTDEGPPILLQNFLLDLGIGALENEEKSYQVTQTVVGE